MVVGLGNPGAEYAQTRHNIGFMILDRLAERMQASLSWKRSWEAEVGLSEGVFLCKPRSFMNRSGQPLAAVSRFYQIPASEILVVLDDTALPLGRLRFRKGGSAGGHNGLKSVIDHMGTDAIARLRFGIGEASGSELSDHVLGRFRPEEKPILEDALDHAVEGIEFAQAHGIEAAMNQYN